MNPTKTQDKEHKLLHRNLKIGQHGELIVLFVDIGGIVDLQFR
jgi:hypothetical protein